MKALTYFAQFPFDYLFGGYPIYLWAILAAIAVVFIVVLFELRYLIRDRFWKPDSASKEISPSTEPPGSFNFSSLKKSIDDLKERQEILIDRFASVQSVLMRMQVELGRLQPNNDSHDQNYIPRYDEQDRYGGMLRSEYANDSSSSASKPGYYPPGTDDGRAESCSDMTDLYNASRTDQSSRARFREKYKPFFINVANDVDRRRNASVPPDFRKDMDGSYLAVPREPDEAAIYPNFTLVVVDAVYGPGALAQVFDCGTFDRHFSYPNIRVAMPATFKLTGGQSWRVTQKGKLDLGPGQDD